MGIDSRSKFATYGWTCWTAVIAATVAATSAASAAAALNAGAGEGDDVTCCCWISSLALLLSPCNPIRFGSGCTEFAINSLLCPSKLECFKVTDFRFRISCF